MRAHILDANALYRFLTKTAGADVVADLFKRALREGQPLLMSVINWGEVFYTLARNLGFERARRIMAEAEILPLTIVDADKSQVEAAAGLKAGYALAYADCFAAALAGKDGVVVTADPEFKARIKTLRILALPRHRQ